MLSLLMNVGTAAIASCHIRFICGCCAWSLHFVGKLYLTRMCCYPLWWLNGSCARTCEVFLSWLEVQGAKLCVGIWSVVNVEGGGGTFSLVDPPSVVPPARGDRGSSSQSSLPSLPSLCHLCRTSNNRFHYTCVFTPTPIKCCGVSYMLSNFIQLYWNIHWGSLWFVVCHMFTLILLLR